MRLATRANGTPDGELMIVSDDAALWRKAGADWPDLLGAIERWDEAEPALRMLSAAGESGWEAFDPALVRAPMPRSWQWLDGSAFTTHGDLMQVAFHLPPVETDRPLMYQGMSDRFLGPHDPVPFRSEDDGIDFEGEFGVIVGAVPMGTGPGQAEACIRLVVQINDWSLRAIAPVEMKTGFGWIQAKPACSMAPFAVTPDELGPAWRDGRVCCNLRVERNGTQFGLVDGSQMAFSFPELIAHAARTRDLAPGTIIGSGTVSNREYAERGSACISERRAIEMIAGGAPQTDFLRYGESVRMTGITLSGHHPFGALDQQVVRA